MYILKKKCFLLKCRFIDLHYLQRFSVKVILEYIIKQKTQHYKLYNNTLNFGMMRHGNRYREDIFKLLSNEKTVIERFTSVVAPLFKRMYI